MKTIDLFCASPASTAICSSLDQLSIIRHGTRPISRLGHTGDRKKILPPIPCQSQLPIDPKSYYQRHRKSSASKESHFDHRKSSADKNDMISPRGSSYYQRNRKSSANKQSDFGHRKSSTDKNDLVSPPSSSRYLLSDTPFFELVSDEDRAKALVPSQKRRPGHLISYDSPSSKSSSTRSRSRPRDQVVELRVSIHCKGCEGKVRRHISRMEGVTSFSIDLATKKVTIIGDVTPLGVLTSVSKVKNAQFWPSPSSASSSPMVRLNY